MGLSRWLRPASYLEWALTGILPVVAVALRVDPTQYSQLPRALLETIQRHAVGTVLALSSAILVLKVVQKLSERWATDHGAIKAVLDSAHKVYFERVAKMDPDRQVYHRVTLFRARKRLRDLDLLHPGRWKPSLTIYCRSGTAYQKSSTRMAIDDEDENANEGVAGRAWFLNGQCTVSDLPEWPTAPGDAMENPVCQEHAAKGRLSVTQAAALKVKSRSLGAHVVRTTTGARWGVVVFDSRDANGVSEAPEKKALLELTAILLSQLV
jgi:hypothetical protein